jgi:hypothetical protein
MAQSGGGNPCRRKPRSAVLGQKILPKKIGTTIPKKMPAPGGLRVRAFAQVLTRGLKGFAGKPKGLIVASAAQRDGGGDE